MNKLINKRIDRLFESKRPVIIVFREKHADVKFACLNRNELECVCLSTLWERYHMGYYCDFGDTDSHTPNMPPISKSDINTMPSGITKNAANQEWEHYEAELSAQKETTHQLKLIETALRERDGTIAFAILKNHSGGEYEGFEVESSNKIENLPQTDLLNIKPKS